MFRPARIKSPIKNYFLQKDILKMKQQFLLGKNTRAPAHVDKNPIKIIRFYQLLNLIIN